MADLGPVIGRRKGIVRIRQLADEVRHRLSFVPVVYVLASVLVVQLLLAIDRRLSTDDVPDLLTTTVGSARSVFVAIAGGLITAITLLLSMTLITVQLASSQFSPRTLRDWIGDRSLQHTVGLALGSTVFALLALRSTRDVGDGRVEVVPHLSLIVAVALAISSLLMLVRSVDHIANSVRVGAVADRIAGETIETIEAEAEVQAGQDPVGVPAGRAARPVDEEGLSGAVPAPAGAFAIEARKAGWVQQIDVETIIEELPEGTRAAVAVPIGSFVPESAPLVWLTPTPDEDDACRTSLHEAFALGDTRTLQQDVSFGLVQLTDIAVRALSPGVNDPGTANEITVHLGNLLLKLWSRPVARGEIERDGKVVVFRRPTHEELLRQACDPIRRYGSEDPSVVLTMLRTLQTVRSEALRRDLPGPVEPLDEMMRTIVDTVATGRWSAPELDDLAELSRRIER